VKNYKKPEIDFIKVVSSDIIASTNGLASWMEGNELTETGVTTYILES